MAEPIGEITILHGTAVAEGLDGVRELQAGSPIYNGETVSTGAKGAVEIKFTDGALLSQGPDSKVSLDDYVFDPSKDAGEITMDLLQGTFRSVTGEIVDMNPEGFKISTPQTTIGIRGTETGHFVGVDGVEQHVVIDFDNKPVVVQPVTGGPPRIISQDGMGVSASGGSVSLVGRAPASILSRFSQLSTSSLQEGAPTYDPGNPSGGEDPGDGQEGQEGQGEQQGQGGPEVVGSPGGDPMLAHPVGQPQEPILSPLLPPPPPPMLPMPPMGMHPLLLSPFTLMAVPEVEVETDLVVETEATVVATVLDLSSRTDAMTVNLAGNPAPYYEITGDSSSRTSVNQAVATVIGSSTQSNKIYGDEQINILTGGAADDTICGACGNDTIFGSGGSDSLDGENDFDFLSYADQTAKVSVNLGSNSVSKYAGGTDEVYNFEGVYGSAYNDTIYATNDANALYGNDGNDLLWGNSGADSLFGGDGDDKFKFESDADAGTIIDGGEGTDAIAIYNTCNLTALTAVSSIEMLYFEDYGSTVTVKASDFPALTTDGGGGTIVMNHTGCTETVNIQASNPFGEKIDLSDITFINWEAGDTINLNGSIGSDTLIGSSVKDTISGAGGTDLLAGGLGADNLTGGAGSDTFVYNALSEAGDIVSDFDNTQDVFKFTFTSLGTTLDAGEFDRYDDVYNGTGVISGEGFVYEIVSATEGNLWYDADGSTSGNETLIATVMQVGGEVEIGDITLV